MKSSQPATEILLTFLVINLALGTSIEKWPTYKHPHSGNGKTYLCYLCPPGYYKSRDCVLPRDNKPGYPECLPCPESQYSQRWNKDGRCWDHDKCEKNHATIYYGEQTGPTKCACIGSNLEDTSGFCVSGISMADHQKEIKSIRKEYEEKLNDAMKTTPCTCPACPTCATKKAQMDSTVTCPICEPLKSSDYVWIIFGIGLIGILIGIVCIVYIIFLKRKLQRCKSGSAKDVEQGGNSNEDGSPNSPTALLIPQRRESSIQATDERSSQQRSPNQPSTRRSSNENDSQGNSREEANIPDVVTSRQSPPVSVPADNSAEMTTPVDEENPQNDERSSQQRSPNQPPTRHQPNENDSQRNSHEEANIPQSPPVSVPADNSAEMTTPVDEENLQNDERPSRRGSPNQPSIRRQPNENDSQRNSRKDADIHDVVTFRRTPPVTVPVGNLVRPTTPVGQENFQNDGNPPQSSSTNVARHNRRDEEVRKPLKAMPDGNPVEPTTPQRVDQQLLQYDDLANPPEPSARTALRNSNGDEEARVRDDHPLRNGNVEDSEKQLDDGLRILENSVVSKDDADYILRNGLRLTAIECQKIANKKNTPAEVIREGYNLWRQQQGSRADIHALIAALRRCEKRYTADKIVQECGIEERKGNQTVEESSLELAIRSCEAIVVDDKISEFFRSNLRLGDREMEELMRDRKTFARKGLLKWVEKNTKENATAEKLIDHFLSADMKNLADNIIDDIRKEYPHYVYKMDSGNVSLQEEPRGTDLKAGPIASSATGTEAEYSLPELAAGSTSRYSSSGHGSPNSERSSRQLLSDSQSEESVSRRQPSSSTSASNTRTGTTREEPESSSQNSTVDEILRVKEDPNNDVTYEDWDNISDYPYEDGKSANRVSATTPSSNGSLNMNNSETRHKETIAVAIPKKSQQMSLDSSISCHKEQKK